MKRYTPERETHTHTHNYAFYPNLSLAQTALEILLVTQDISGQPFPHGVAWRDSPLHVQHVSLGHHPQQLVQGGHGGQVTGVVQEQNEHAVRERVGDAALCLLNREAAQPLVLGEGSGYQQQDLLRVN